jgi:hypothetical protein
MAPRWRHLLVLILATSVRRPAEGCSMAENLPVDPYLHLEEIHASIACH